MKNNFDYNLLQGTHNYFADFGRSVRIWREFRKGFRALSKVNHCVSIFGSARFKEDNPYYKLAYDTAYLMGREGYHIMTGGGPGIMEAANKGHRMPALYRSAAQSSCLPSKSRIPIRISVLIFITFSSGKSCC